MLKSTVKNLLYASLPSFLITLLICELLVFRYIIPATEFPYWYYDATYSMLRYDSTLKTTGLATFGPLAKQRAHFRINNHGWNSEIDYDPNHKKPLIAIIGDSYVEGFQVEPDRSISARLGSLLGGKYEVYRFGTSGAPLSQYLNISRYVDKLFNPDVLVFNVVHNDFDEMLASLTPKYVRGMLYVDTSDHGIVEKPIEPFSRQAYWEVLRKSAILRYLYFNCGVSHFYWRIKDFFRHDQTRYEANVDVGRVLANRVQITDAVDYVLQKIKTENPSRRVIFMMDAARNDIYKGTLDKSDVTWMNGLLAEKCEKYGLEFIDLNDYFASKYKATGKKYESLDGWHWNENGHESAAEALFNKILNP